MADKPASLSSKDRKIIVTLCLMIVFGNINLTMFNLAVPFISRDYGLSSSQVSWVMVGYSMIMAVGAGTYSKLAEIFSIRHLYAAGLLIFAAGSLLGFFANSYALVIAGRLVQAAGASCISPLSYGLISRFFAAGLRGKVLGVLSATIAFASGFGPVFGGFVEEYAGWHVLFLISGLCLLLIPLVLKHIPDTGSGTGNFDIPGMVLFSAGLALLMAGVTMNLWVGLMGLAALFCFWCHIRKARSPFISPSLLKNSRYRRILWVALITFLCNTGLTFMVPLIMVKFFHLAVGTIGLIMVPASASAALLGLVIGRWIDKYGSLRVLLFSQVLAAAGFALLSLFDRLAILAIALLMIVPVVGLNGMLTSSGKLISLTLKPDEQSMGMGLYTLAYLLGGAVGPAVVGRWIDLDFSFRSAFLLLAAAGAASLLPAVGSREPKRTLMNKKTTDS